MVGMLAVPNVMKAQFRRKATQTMADMRAIGSALEFWSTDHNAYPATRSIDDLAPLLVPKYMKTLPRTDAWGRRLEYSGSAVSFCLASAGPNGSFEATTAQLLQSPGNAEAIQRAVAANAMRLQPPRGTSDDFIYVPGAFLSYLEKTSESDGWTPASAGTPWYGVALAILCIASIIAAFLFHRSEHAQNAKSAP